jgi:acyl carrier protein
MNDTPAPQATDLAAWLTELVATYLDVSPDTIDRDVDLATYGIDSVYALSIASDIEDHLGLDVDPTYLRAYPTITTLADRLHQLVRGT